MENVLAAFIIIFILLFVVFTLAESALTTQDTLQVSWRDMQARLDDQTRTHLDIVQSRILQSGTLLELVVENTGTTRLADFDLWDAMIEYYDDDDPTFYHILWLAYADDSLEDNEWLVEGVYLDAVNLDEEIYEPTVLNSGEELLVQVSLYPAVGAGKTLQATLSTSNGIAVSTFARRNIPPVLAQNLALTVPGEDSTTISAAFLQTTDEDNISAELVYTVTAPPQYGSLSLGATFTQAQIDGGALDYTHTGGEPDSFTFTVSDGIDTIGPYTFNINVNDPPELTTNNGLALGGQPSGVIDGSALEATDPDNSASELVYSVTSAPSQGTLSLSGPFTQADVNAGLLVYTSGGGSADSFEFTVSDGQNLIGTFSFDITP